MTQSFFSGLMVAANKIESEADELHRQSCLTLSLALIDLFEKHPKNKIAFDYQEDSDAEIEVIVFEASNGQQRDDVMTSQMGDLISKLQLKSVVYTLGGEYTMYSKAAMPNLISDIGLDYHETYAIYEKSKLLKSEDIANMTNKRKVKSL